VLGEERSAALGLLAMGADAYAGLLSDGEEAALEAGMREHGRAFRRLATLAVPGRSAFELQNYYYNVWKLRASARSSAWCVARRSGPWLAHWRCGLLLGLHAEVMCAHTAARRRSHWWHLCVASGRRYEAKAAAQQAEVQRQARQVAAEQEANKARQEGRHKRRMLREVLQWIRGAARAPTDAQHRQVFQLA
jgi:hypothetical protein